MTSGFKGFSDETFEFFMAIRYNNNREFFAENHDWYLRAVREPALALARELSDTIEQLDPELERRDNRVVSRINRDLRYARNMPLYRDYVWLAFRIPGADRGKTISAWFDISDEEASCGIGMYMENKAMLANMRVSLINEPDRMPSLFRTVGDEYELHVERAKRLKIPEELSGEAREWYNLKSFYLMKKFNDYDLMKSPALADEVKKHLLHLKPVYDFFKEMTPREEAEEDGRMRF